ncbi:CHAT domain-containing protein [Microcoleus sp. N9_B2]|uniref:CHAT domain-containing protein n=1 Tax=unclassified Microcoleus TaxID=2642155 RepID=UPI002FD36EB4
MNEARREAYLNLIDSLLTCPSEEQIPILRAHLELIDDNFAQFLREWAIQTLATLDAEPAYNVANILHGLAKSFYNLRQGSRTNSLEAAIACLESGLTIVSSEAYSEKWARFQNSLGVAYLCRIRGEKAENLERAIAAFLASLEIYTREAFPFEWARSQNNLGAAYLCRIRGEKAENQERAIAAFLASLEIRTREAFPEDCAKSQKNLGEAYLKRIRGEKAENLERAIAAFLASLEIYTREAFPENWASSQNSLGAAYLYRIRGEKAENQERAIAAFLASLEIYTREAFPENWARSQNNLGVAYSNRIRGEKADNLEQAIAACLASLEIYTREAFPEDWASSQNNLGVAYRNRIRGEKAENQERDIAACLASLEIYTREAFPFEWARSQKNLGEAYRNRIRGEKAENLERAIAASLASLEIYTREAFPEDWASSQNNLGIAYGDRIRGGKAENQEREIAACLASLEIYTREAFPFEWARSQHNLGLAYFYRIRGEKAENLERAIAAYQVSLEISTREAFPIEYTETSFNLGFAYQNNSQLPEAYNTFNSAIETVESMRREIIIGGEADKQKLAEKWDKLYQEMVEVCLEMGNNIAALEYVERSKTRNLVELFHKFRSSPEKLQRISFDNIRNLLTENEAILEWYISYNNFKVFIIARDSTQPNIWQSSYKDLKALEEFKQEYIDSYTEESDDWTNQLETRLEKLAQILHIDEIIARLPENCQKLILVPFRYLHLFPLHALTSSRQKADKTVETGCLLELFPGGVRYTPSCQLLQLSQRVNLTAEDTLPSKFFAIQNPTEDLDFTDIEVEAIAKSFNPAEILSRQNASKTVLLQQIASLQNADIAHFSCHGFFDFLNPQKSSLILAGAKVTPLNPPLLRGETREDFPLLSEETGGKETPPLSKGGLGGVPSDEKRYIRSRRGENFDIAECLTLEEIFDLQLIKCSLVVLSACETGLTDIKNTTDEYIGLPSGFLYAGATSVLSTLWAVNDVSTAILTIKFYELLRGENRPPVAIALRESQLWLRSVTVKDLLEWVEASQLLSREHKQKIQGKYRRGYKPDYQPYESPVHWAAFCAVGQ